MWLCGGKTALWKNIQNFKRQREGLGGSNFITFSVQLTLTHSIVTNSLCPIALTIGGSVILAIQVKFQIPSCVNILDLEFAHSDKRTHLL